ncbi:MAG: GGDEF domain-containing protein [Spirochaetes bacterium]|nr:GGDEF domain-containing protein [Spirochaetota bacterium]
MSADQYLNRNINNENRLKISKTGEWREQTAQQLVRYEALFSLLDDIQGVENISKIAGLVAKQWKYFANVTAWRLLVYDENDFMAIDGHKGHAQVRLIDEKDLDEWDLFTWNECRPAVYTLSETEINFTPPLHLTGRNIIQVQVLPVYHQANCIAVLTAGSRNKPFNELDNRYIRLMANYFADRVLSLMLQDRALKILHTKATRDSLTGLLNRGAVLEQFDTMLALGKRSSHPVSVIIADIDFFKKINDTYGHQAGDMVIQEVARRFDKTARESDCVGRYGGEEFIVILNNCGISQILQVAERFRKTISKDNFPVNSITEKELKISVTISAGVSCTEGSAGYNSLHLIKEADKALYLSKNNGRNTVTAGS